MNDLISRQAAIDAMCLACGHDCDKSKFVYNAPQDEQVIMCPEHYALSTMPSAQPEIIRCKDCKYRYIDEVHGPSCELDTGDPYATGRNADEDNWFCADAERRTDE